MKKVIPAVIVVAAIAAVAFIYFQKAVIHHVSATELVPADAVFFAHLPNLRRTAERWPKTALAQIGEEPEVKAFLAKPRANAPQMKLWDEKVAQLYRVAPGEAFIAVTSIEGNQPRYLAGFSYAGRKAEVETLLAEPREELKRNWPTGKSDVTLQGKTEIDTFTFQDTTIGEAFESDWYFVSNDMELLRRTIDIAEKGLGEKSIGASDLYRKSTARLPADGEVVLFAQLGSLTDRLVSLLVASGQAPDPKQTAELKKIQAVAWGTKFEDALMRDTLFILSPGNTAEAPLAQQSLALSNADTFLTYSTALPASIELPDSPALAAFLPSLAGWEKDLADKGLQFADFSKAFGPEFGVTISWPKDNPQPSTLLTLDVRDAALAKRFFEALVPDLTGVPAGNREEKDGATIYETPPTPGLAIIPPLDFALNDRFLILGFGKSDVLAALERLKAGKGTIAATPAFEQATKAVGKPTSGFGYIDLKTLVDRSYSTFRPFLAMSLAFSPDSAKYVDAGRLPGTEAISKHLSPAVYSQSVTADGTLVESVGPLTFNQVIGLSVGGAIAAALPTIESTLGGSFKLDPSSLQLTPPQSVPPAKQAPAPPKANPPASAAPANKPAVSTQ